MVQTIARDSRPATVAAPRRIAQANRAFERGDFVETQRLCRALLEIHPGHAAGLRLLGMAAVKTRQLDVALSALPKAIAAGARDAMAYTYLGAAQLLSDRNREALASTTRALKLNPKNVLTLNIRACVLGNLGRHRASLACCDRALEIQPDNTDVLVNRGNALVQLQRLEEALDSFERARRIRPGLAPAVNNCATLLTQLKRFDEALRCYDEALRLQPDYAEAAFSRGVILGDLGRPREAIKSYLRALEIRPDYLDARCNLAYCRLQLGDFAQGWKDYDAQWRKSVLAAPQLVLKQPLWTGAEPLRGKSLLLYAEQGLGDTLQFCRYAKLAKARGARVVLAVQRPLLKLLAPVTGVDQLVAKDGRLPKTDYYCPLMKLPGGFNADLNNIPAAIPYIQSDPALAARWRKRLGTVGGASGARDTTRLRIGVAWSGNPAHGNDLNRSLTLDALLPLLNFEAEWFSLQKEVRAADAATLARHARFTPLVHLGEHIRDFSDTAALVEHMDLVISVDTSVAHLAGAMGKPVWILLPFNPDWRWLLKRTDSPWYPTARLFRQPAIGDWAGVMAAVGKALTRWRKGSRGSRGSG